VFAQKTVEEMWTYFKHKTQALCSSHVPSRSATQISGKKTWMTIAAKKLWEKQKAVCTKYNSCSSTNYKEYRKLETKSRKQPKSGTKLYCLVTEAHACEQLAQGCYPDADRPRFEPAIFRIASKYSTVKPHRPINSHYLDTT